MASSPMRASGRLVPALDEGKQTLARLAAQLRLDEVAALLSGYRLVKNTGDGNCFVHAFMHVVGATGLGVV